MLLEKSNCLVLLVDVQEKLTPHVLHHDTLVARCQWILQLAKRMAVPVIVSEQYPRGLGPTVAPLRPFFSSSECIEKVHFSCAAEPRLLMSLREPAKQQLILIGIEAHVCVLQTALELKTLGFEIFVVVDAVSSRHPVDLQYGLKRMKQAGIYLITAEMLFFEWLRVAGTTEFKSLSKEFLQ